MKRLKLGDLHPGAEARIVSVQAPSEEMTRLFLEMGLLEGSAVRIVHEAPFSRDPIAVEVRGALLALRRQEATAIEVEISEGAAP